MTWHPVALATSVPPGSVLGTMLDGVSVAVWCESRQAGERDGTDRTDYNSMHVWEDRCPHRGMALSLGFVRDDRLTCLYHGWRFDGEGLCRHIPAHPSLVPPSTICATLFQARTVGGLVWASLEGAYEPDASAFPVPVRTIILDVPAQVVRDRLDMMPERSVVQPEADIPLTAAINPTGPDRTDVHVTCNDRADRLAAARWATSFRRTIQGRGRA